MRFWILALAAALSAGAVPAAAQSLWGPAVRSATEQPLGWSFTPMIDYGTVWDSNVLFDNEGDVPVSQLLQMLRGQGRLDFRGRRTEMGADYRGSFVFYPELRSLNSYDQRLSARLERRLTRRFDWNAGYGLTKSPTTELTELAGVPFERTGLTLHDASTGASYALGRRTSIGGIYRFQHVTFDRDPALPNALLGGHSHGGTLTLKHALTTRTSLTADYYLQFATLINRDSFQVQTAWAGLEHTLSEQFTVSGAAGVSRLGSVGGREPRLGPALRLGISRAIDRATATATYSRSYVPSYGFGGTMQNEQLTARLQVPVARRLYTHSSVDWRRNEPLDEGLRLRSLWVGGGVGYALQSWVHVEAYSAGTWQRIDMPGGELRRFQFGVSVTAAKTTRVH